MSLLRHDEQEDETHYDSRVTSCDDIEKGKIRFVEGQLFGCEEELKQLHQQFQKAESSIVQIGESSSTSRSKPKRTSLAQAIFLEGCAGCGKSSLIDCFERQLHSKRRRFRIAKGKHNKHVQMEPFAEIDHALYSLLKECQKDSDPLWQKVEILLEDVGSSRQLLAVLPSLGLLFAPSAAPKTYQEDTTYNIDQLCLAFANFLKMICETIQVPLILFLDDLQWADAASMQLISEVLRKSPLPNLFFVGAYRSNGISNQDQVHCCIQEIIRERDDVLRITVSNLSRRHISLFLASTLNLDLERVETLSEALFTRTMGNILYCRQALEEMARKNILYYDVMSFQWEFNLDGVDLNCLLSDDVVELIKSKLQSLPTRQQEVLSVAAFIRNMIDIPILQSCLKAEGNSLTTQELEGILKNATEEGLLICYDQGRRYRFAHDRVQEAAHSVIPDGDEQQKLQLRIATVLLQSVNSSDKALIGNEWMAFVAAEYFARVPKNTLTEDRVHVVELFLKVAQISAGKASFHKTVSFLRSALEILRLLKLPWKNHYHLSLQTFNQLMKAEFAVGKMDEARAAVNEVMSNYRSLKDTSIAYHTKVEWTVKVNSGDFTKGIEESVKLLKTYGLHIPSQPSKLEVLVEVMRMKVALRGRSIVTMTRLPVADCDKIMSLLFQLCHMLALGKHHDLNTYVTMKAIRMTINQGMTKYLPEILMTYTAPLRIAGKHDMAYSYAELVNNINAVFPRDKGAEYAKEQLILYAGILPLKNSFSESLDALNSSYRICLSCGDVENALNSALNVPMLYFAASLPLNMTLEPMLLLYEEKSRQLDRPGFSAIFQCSRQFLYNLTQKLEFPTELEGKALREQEVLSQLEGNMKKMTIRDFSTFRIALACFYNDELCMEKMMQRLEPYPLFDMPVARQHLRMTFQGIAAFVLCRRHKTNKYLKIGRTILQEFKKLKKIGSVNARPVHKCLIAVQRHQRKQYDRAIASCSEQKVTHLEALMNEYCGVLLLENGDEVHANDYLHRAVGLYQNWGAHAKANSLKSKYQHLSFSSRVEKAESSSSRGLVQNAYATLKLSKSTFASSAGMHSKRQRQRSDSHVSSQTEEIFRV